MMKLTEMIQEGKTCLALSGEMTIFDVAGNMDMLLHYAGLHPFLVVDVSGVTTIDMAGLQLLMLLKKESGKAACTIFFQHHSQAVLDIASLLHMEVFFDIGETS
jgi:anti-sigma B factor antagonist